MDKTITKQIRAYKQYIIVGIIILLACIGFFYWKYPVGANLQIRNQIFKIEVAVTRQAVEKGLGQRENLPIDTGMLFLFPNKEQYTFWMKDMHFPIDIIWIDDNTIVDISKNVPVAPAGQSLPTYAPQKPVNRVLEINAGLSDKYNFQIGDRVTYITK